MVSAIPYALRCPRLLTGQIILMDGAHHLANGNNFSDLRVLTAEGWDAAAAAIRKNQAADRSSGQ